MAYQGTTFYWNANATRVDRITQQYRVTNNNFYPLKWDSLELNQTCHGVDQPNVLAASLAPGQSLHLSTKKSATWDVDWDVAGGAHMKIHSQLHTTT